MTQEELTAAVKKYEESLKSEGFATIQELIGAYQTACAERDKAAGARDKFKADADKYQETIRAKSGEIGALKQQVLDLEEKASEKGGEPPAAPAAPATPAAPAAPAAPATKPEDELATIEASLTDAQKEAADALLEAMDDDTAVQYTNDVGTRLEFFKGLVSDPALKQAARPKSFFKKADDTPAKPTENAYEAILKRVGKVVPGPGGSVAVKGKAAQPARQEAAWLNS